MKFKVCRLCQREFMHGGVDMEGSTRVDLCHDDERSCYRAWTVYGVRNAYDRARHEIDMVRLTPEYRARREELLSKPPARTLMFDLTPEQEARIAQAPPRPWSPPSDIEGIF